MPLVSCPECGRAISTRAAACPGCGHPAARHGRWTRGVALLLVLAVCGWTYARYAPGFGWHAGGRVDSAEMSRVAPPAASELTAAPEREVRALETPALAPRGEAARPSAAPEVDDGQAYETWEVEALPELANRAEVDSLLELAYPETLRDNGVAGEVSVRMLVRPDGLPEPGTVLVEKATSPVFARAALPVVGKMRFRPAVVAGMAVSVWVTIPIEFQIDLTPDPDEPPPPVLPTS